MKLTVPFVALLLVGCAQAPAPVPVAQKAEIPPPPPGYVEVPAGYVLEKAPTKDEFIAEGRPSSFNREQAAKREAQIARDDAEWAANQRADRIVRAQQETRQAVERVESKLD